MTVRRSLLLFVLSLPLFAITLSAQTFTRADSLRGYLFPERACYDVRYYALDVRVDPADSSVRGSNTIFFTVMSPMRRLQVDLFAEMKVDRVTPDDAAQSLPVTREFGALFIALPKQLAAGSVHRLRFDFGGRPQAAKNPPWDGGFSWKQSSDGTPWIVVTCQGTGASLW